MTLLAAALWTVTSYGLGCDAPGPLTRAGTRPVPGFTVAADPRVLPLGSIVEIEGHEYMVHDVGGAVHGRTLDVFVASCGEARRWGRRQARVRIIHRGGSR